MNKRLLLLGAVSALVLAGCADEQTDLRAWMAEVRRTTPPVSEVIPEPKKFEPYRYQSAEQVAPFDPEKLSSAIKVADRRSSTLAPDMRRRKEPLESYPTDTIQMVGHLQQRGRMLALLQADQMVYQARVGNYVGQNYGLITRISENEVKVKELVQDTTGDWVERETTLQLQESGK